MFGQIFSQNSLHIFFRLSPKVRFFIFPVSYCFDVSRKPRHGKMHEVRYRKFPYSTPLKTVSFTSAVTLPVFPFRDLWCFIFPQKRFHQNQKRMLPFEDHFSFSTANSSHNVQTSEIRKLAPQIVYHHQVNLQKRFKRIFDISSFSNFSWTLETEVFEKTTN